MPEFRARINAYADEVLEPDQLRPRLRIDGPLNLQAITHDLVQRPRRDGPVRPGQSRARSSTPGRSRSSTARARSRTGT